MNNLLIGVLRQVLLGGAITSVLILHQHVTLWHAQLPRVSGSGQ